MFSILSSLFTLLFFKKPQSLIVCLSHFIALLNKCRALRAFIYFLLCRLVRLGVLFALAVFAAKTEFPKGQARRLCRFADSFFMFAIFCIVRSISFVLQFGTVFYSYRQIVGNEFKTKPYHTTQNGFD